ncbi:MAG: tRNA/rRNA methyltransferase [Elusimicrobia bacterium]|nr:tRNA/rRNA methyltransferase [Elusimicrobiota bacterium]
MEIYFILAGPAVPGNIGAAARALKTMGFANLRLVNPVEYDCPEARAFACGSLDILKNAGVYKSIRAAVEDMDLVIGTTSKKRVAVKKYFTCEELPGMLKNIGPALSRAAVLFGSEKTGLRNEELKYCDILSTIPIYRKYPSLNLAQAVMVYSYCLSPMVMDSVPEKGRAAEEGQFRKLKDKVGRVLELVGFPAKNRKDNRLLDRLSRLKYEDIRLLHALAGRILEKIEPRRRAGSGRSKD